MKYPMFLSIILLATAAAAFAQLPAGYTEIYPQTIATGKTFDSTEPCKIRGDGVYGAESLDKLLKDAKCDELLKSNGFNPNAHTLVGYTVGGDCHMEVRSKTFRSEKDKTILLIVNSLYGGCRAGGWRSGLFMLDKIPDDFKVEVKKVGVDRVHGPKKSEEFVYPKQPTGIKPEVLESREVDVNDCLPMTGQSQWVFIKEEFLQSGLERESSTLTQCRELFAGLAIDFNKYNLVGYNVGTGHCYRPQGIESRLVKDYDEEVYRLEISYPRPRGFCHVIRYFPIWVVVPKSPMGYGFRIEAKATVQSQ